MTFCHCLLQHTTYMLSCLSKINEWLETREVFFQWLSGHSQTDKCLVILYRLGISIAGISIAFLIQSLDLFASLIPRYSLA